MTLSNITQCVVASAVSPALAAPCRGELTAPEVDRIIRETREAFASGDVRRLAELVELPAASGDTRSNVERCDELLRLPRAENVAILLEGFSARTIDRELRCPGSGRWACPPGAVRVICEYHLPAAVKVPPLYDLEVHAICFVPCDGRWKWYMPKGMFLGYPWGYTFGASDAAYHSTVLALEARDYRTIYEMIDPDCLPSGMTLEAWLSSVRERVAAVDRAEEESKAAREAARIEGRPMPKDTAPPFVAIGQFGDKAESHYVNDEKTIAYVSHLWDKADKLKEPVPYETFVKRGDRWYWQPKPEYTLWPLATNSPTTTQPATAPSKQER